MIITMDWKKEPVRLMNDHMYELHGRLITVGVRLPLERKRALYARWWAWYDRNREI